MNQGEKIIVKGFSNVFEHMCNFMAVAKTGRPNETLEGLIQLCFVLKPEEKFSTNASFAEQIEQLFGLEIPKHQIQVALETMTSKRIVSKPVGTNIVLNVKLKQQIKEKIEESQELEERVKESWLESIAQKYPELPIEKMWPALQGYLSRAFRRHGMQAASLLDPSIDTPGEYAESLSQLLMEVIEDKFDIKERPCARKAVSAFLAEVATDPERTEYIAQLADGAFNFYTLEVSPDLTAKLQANLNEMVLFLDTNFLFGILGLHNNSQVEVSHELIRAITTHKLPFRLRYHEATEREMRNTISYYSQILRGKRWTQGLSKVAATITDLSGLEIKFHEQNVIQRIDIDEFLRPYQHLDVLLREKGIDIFRSSEDRLQERTDLHYEYKEFLKRHHREDKVYETINHDVTLLDAVRQRRSNSKSTLEASALLVSCDYLLNTFDWETARQTNHMACVVLPNIFWQILKPFIPTDHDFARSFAQTFAIPEFRAIGSKGSQACSKMLSILASYKNVPEETAFKMLSNDVLLDKLKSTKDDKQFMECVEAAFVEENKNLLEEKAAMAKQLEKEKRTRAAKEKAAAEKLQVLTSERNKLQRDLSQKESEVQHAETVVIKSQKEHQETEKELSEIQEMLKAEKAARIKAEDEKGRHSKTIETMTHKVFINRIIYAVIFIFVLVGFFEIWLYSYKWPWLWNHTNSIGLEVSVVLLIACFAFSMFVPRFRNWSALAAVVPIILIVIPLLGGRVESADVQSPTSTDAEINLPSTQVPESPVTIDEVFRTLKSDSLTDLQKSEFKKKHNGRTVRWTGYVASVALRYKQWDDAGFIIAFRPESQKDESFPDLVIASFPQTAKTDLIDLNEMDWIEIQGRLHCTDTGTISLEESKLIKREKHKKKIEKE